MSPAVVSHRARSDRTARPLVRVRPASESRPRMARARRALHARWPAPSRRLAARRGNGVVTSVGTCMSPGSVWVTSPKPQQLAPDVVVATVVVLEARPVGAAGGRVDAGRRLHERQHHRNRGGPLAARWRGRDAAPPPDVVYRTSVRRPTPLSIDVSRPSGCGPTRSSANQLAGRPGPPRRSSTAPARRTARTSATRTVRMAGAGRCAMMRGRFRSDRPREFGHQRTLAHRRDRARRRSRRRRGRPRRRARCRHRRAATAGRPSHRVAECAVSRGTASR